MRKRISLTVIVSVSCFGINKYDEPTCVVPGRNLKRYLLLFVSASVSLDCFCNKSEKQIILTTKSDVYEASCSHTQIDHNHYLISEGSRN